MEVKVLAGRLELEKADASLVGLFDGPGAGFVPADLAEPLRTALAALAMSGDARGKAYETAVFYPRGEAASSRVVVVGLGRPEEFSLERARLGAGAAARKARELGARKLAVSPLSAGSREDSGRWAQATIEGALLGLYEFRELKSAPAEHVEVMSLALLEGDSARLPAAQGGARLGRILAEATMLARDLVNRPSNGMTPRQLARAAHQVAARSRLKLTLLSEAEMKALGMGGLLGVARGSQEGPQFILLEYRPRAGAPLVLVGKGLTFDSGGISLKPVERMEEMKSDMAGGAAVIAAMQAIAQLDLPVHVVGIVPACENLPSGRSYKPGDVLRAMNGKTIEVITTDAEGRLILADALSYAARFRPDAVVDLATLTGSCVIALGEDIAAGLFSSDVRLAAELREAGALAGENLWPMPLYSDYMDRIRSEVADLKNSSGKYGGVGTSALFLQQFTSYPWAHLDIAPVAFTTKGNSCTAVGATGFGVRTLVEWVRARAGQGASR